MPVILEKRCHFLPFHDFCSFVRTRLQLRNTDNASISTVINFSTLSYFVPSLLLRSLHRNLSFFFSLHPTRSSTVDAVLLFFFLTALYSLPVVYKIPLRA